MADNSGIEWTDSSLSLWFGCTQLSAACDHCYAKAIAGRLQVEWNGPPRIAAESAWAKIAAYQRGAKRWMKKHGRPRRVFINHLSDFLDNQADPAWQRRACIAFEAAPDVIWIIVTKRPQNARKFMPGHWFKRGGWPRNVWFLVTGEDQVEYDRRVAEAITMGGPDWIGVSMEPMLETILPGGSLSFSDIDRYAWAHRILKRTIGTSLIARVGWIILGGESGPRARPYPEREAAAIARTASAAGIPVFSKQLGQADHPSTFKQIDTFPADLRIRSHPA